MNLDKSSILQDIIKTCKSPNEVLAELQFAFVTFLLGENYESFEQWKSLTVLLCNCQSALTSPDTSVLFFNLVPVIYS
jgi:A1 cistron-splicing factor AAR2